MELIIELPDIKPLVNLDGDYFKKMLIANLYHLGRLSEKEAREILEISRRQFEDLLPQFEFAILGDSPDNIKFELNPDVS